MLGYEKEIKLKKTGQGLFFCGLNCWGVGGSMRM